MNTPEDTLKVGTHAGDQELKGRAAVRAVLADAEVELREEDILAVLTIRRQREVSAFLEELVLKGDCGAVLMNDSMRDEPLALENFGFYWLTEEERSQRPIRPAYRTQTESPRGSA